MKYSFLFTFLFLITISSMSSKEDSITLKLNLEKGQKYLKRKNDNLRIDCYTRCRKLWGMHSNLFLETSYEFEVIDIDSNFNYLINLKFSFDDYTQINKSKYINMDNMQLLMETQSEAENIENPMKYLRNIKLQILMTPKGVIKNIKGVDSILPRKYDDCFFIKDMCQSFISDYLNKNMFSENFAYLTGEELSIGDSVIANYPILLSNDLIVTAKYTLINLDDKFAYFDVTYKTNKELNQNEHFYEQFDDVIPSKLIINRKTCFVESLAINTIIKETYPSNSDTTNKIIILKTINTIFEDAIISPKIIR